MSKQQQPVRLAIVHEIDSSKLGDAAIQAGEAFKAFAQATIRAAAKANGVTVARLLRPRAPTGRKRSTYTPPINRKTKPW